MPFRYFSAADIETLLTMRDCVDALEPAMAAASAGEVAVPPRLMMPLIDDSGILALMPGSMGMPRFFGAKVVSFLPANPSRGRPPIQGFVALFDHDSGELAALADGGALTAIRTAAASALATRWLAREEASTCGIFGTGVQARSHVAAMLAVRRFGSVVVWGRSRQRAQALVEELNRSFDLPLVATDDPAEAAACDVLCTVTSSPEPVLRGDWVRPGTHVNLVGAHTAETREADTALISAASVFVDLVESAETEAGDLLIPRAEGAIDHDHTRREIGRVISGELPGRQSSDEITVYKSLGITVQDLAAAACVLERAAGTNVGTELST